MTHEETMKTLVLWTVIILLFGLLVASLYVRDYKYIALHPLYFFIELFLIGVIPAFLILIFIKTRNLAVHEAFWWALILMIKFSLLHALLQLSGIYTLYFPRG